MLNSFNTRLLILVNVVLLSGESFAQSEEAETNDKFAGVDIVLDNGDTISIAGEEVLIEGRGQRPKFAELEIGGREAAAVAGVQGDALKAVRTLSGVARTPAGSQGLSVWGAAPSDTRLYVDDVPIPRLFHLGGNRSVLPSHEIESFRLIPGGASARFGRAIGGAVEVRTTEPGLRPVEFLVHVDPFDVGLHASSRFAESSWVSLSTRASLLSESLDAIAPMGFQDLVPVPDTFDFQARAGHVLDSGDSLRMLIIGSSDHLERGIPSVQADQAFSELSDSEFVRVGLSLLREHNNVTRKITVWVGSDRDEQDLRFGAVSAFGRKKVSSAGLLLQEDIRLSDTFELRVGADGQYSRSRFSRQGALSLPSREGDIFVFGGRPGNRINEDNWQVDAASLGLFLSAKIAPADWVDINAGFRFEPAFTLGKRVLPARPSEAEIGYSDLQVAADPRLRVSLRPSSAWNVFAAAGRYHQSPSADDLSPVFGSPVLAQASAWQALLGAEVSPMSALRIEVLAFVARQQQLAVRSELATPSIAALLRSTGQGENLGSQISVRVDVSENLYGSLSYSAMRARRRSDDTSPWRRFDADQRHVLRAASQWKLASGVSLGGRLEFGSGMPRTPVVDSVFNTSSQSFDPIFGAHNSSELGMFVEVSARLGYEKTYSWGEMLVWLDALNLTNHKNVEEVFYSSDFRTRSSVTGLPLLAVVGVELRL